jgi:uncharacterized protein (DUF2141 family)
MYIWSFVLFMCTQPQAMQQLPSPEGTVCIAVPALKQAQGVVQCTVYDSQQMPVRFIPLESGHKQGIYTIRLQTLPAGTYKLTVQQQSLDIQLEK